MNKNALPCPSCQHDASVHANEKVNRYRRQCSGKVGEFGVDWCGCGITWEEIVAHHEKLEKERGDRHEAVALPVTASRQFLGGKPRVGYVDLAPGVVPRTSIAVGGDSQLVLDFDPNNRLVGIEFLNPEVMPPVPWKAT